MQVEKVVLSEKRNVSLTAYVLDSSIEMPNICVRPGVLVLPGGGYYNCSDREAEPVAMVFLEAGYNAFVLRYSVGENAAFPQPLEDAETALQMIRENAEKWNIDENKIAAIGFSAGGHLSAALASMGKVRPNASILGYPCITGELVGGLAAEIPPVEKHVTKKTPPTFIFGSSEDTRVPIQNSLVYASALAENGVPFEMHVFEKGQHGFSVATNVVCRTEELLSKNRLAAQWTKMCVDWLKNLFEI